MIQRVKAKIRELRNRMRHNMAQRRACRTVLCLVWVESGHQAAVALTNRLLRDSIQKLRPRRKRPR